MNIKSALLLFSTLILFTLEGRDLLIEPRAGYFFPKEGDFREIYSTANPLFGGEVSYCIKPSVALFGSAGYYHDRGSSIGERDSTEITMLPLGFGFKYLYPFRHGNFYCGAGMAYTYLQIKDDSNFVTHIRSKWGPGGVLKFGALVKSYKRCYLDLFSDVYITKIKFHNTDDGGIIGRNVDLSGWSLGIGWGWRFGVPNTNCKK